MDELKACDITLLEKRLKNLSTGLENMDNGGDIMVNRAMLTACRDYMAELLALRRVVPKSKRLIDADALTEEIQHLQIFIGGESLFTPAIKETVLRTIDDQPTVSAVPGNKPLICPLLSDAEVKQPCLEGPCPAILNEPLTLEELRGMIGAWVWVEYVDKRQTELNGWYKVDDAYYDNQTVCLRGIDDDIYETGLRYETVKVYACRPQI